MKKYRRYNKKSEYSYTLGIIPTIELLKTKPEAIAKIVTHSKLNKDTLKLANGYIKKHHVTAECNDQLISKLSTKENCCMVGFFKKYYPALGGGNHVVLVNPRNPGNLGTITRCMLAFDFTDLAIIRPAVDIFAPKTIRASMGALFAISFQFFNSMTEYKEVFNNHNLYAFMADGQSTLEKVNFEYPYSLVFGNESSGLSNECTKLGNSVRILHSMRVDSLNLSISTGIVLHYLYAQGK